MSTHHNDQQTGEHPDQRNLEGKPKADALPVKEIDEKTADQLDQDALDAGLRHPNRNYDKPDIDKPAYGGGH